jgi:hypothetical protein
MDAPALQLFIGDEEASSPVRVRGVGWVLEQAALIAVLVMTATALTAFAYELAAERALARAAAAGLREAALPRATTESVEATVRRRLAGGLALDRAARVRLARAGDRLAINLSVPTAAVLPRWLPVGAWSDSTQIEFRTEQPVVKLLGAR